MRKPVGQQENHMNFSIHNLSILFINNENSEKLKWQTWQTSTVDWSCFHANLYVLIYAQMSFCLLHELAPVASMRRSVIEWFLGHYRYGKALTYKFDFSEEVQKSNYLWFSIQYLHHSSNLAHWSCMIYVSAIFFSF